MFGWLRRSRRPSLTNVALKLEKAFAAKVVAAFKAGEPELTKEQIGSGVHGDLALAYLSEYVIAVCTAYGYDEAKDQGVATAMVMDRALHIPEDEIIPTIMRVRSRVVAAISAFGAVEGVSVESLPPETQTMLAVGWGGKENGERFARDSLNGSDELTAKEIADYSAIVLGKLQIPVAGG